MAIRRNVITGFAKLQQGIAPVRREYFLRQNPLHITLKKRKKKFVYDLIPFLSGFSFRLLRKEYEGSCLRVKRMSDNVYKDIGFSNNVLDETELLNFIGPNNGKIQILYDQGPAESDATAPYLVSEPLIVSAGTLLKRNSRIVTRLDNAENALTPSVPFIILTQPWTIIASEYATSAGGNVRTISATFDQGFGARRSASDSARNKASTSVTPEAIVGAFQASQNAAHVMTLRCDAAGTTYFVDGIDRTVPNTRTDTLARMNIGYARPAFGPGDTDFFECLCFNSALSTANKQLLENNIKTYYGVQ